MDWMQIGIESAVDALAWALDSKDPEAICHASSVLYTTSLEAALTRNGVWPLYSERVQALYARAVQSAALTEADVDQRYLSNVRDRAAGLERYYVAALDAAKEPVHSA